MTDAPVPTPDLEPETESTEPVTTPSADTTAPTSTPDADAPDASQEEQENTSADEDSDGTWSYAQI